MAPRVKGVGMVTVPVKVGLADKTTLPVPVEVVVPVPPLATAKVPVTWARFTSPVAPITEVPL